MTCKRNLIEQAAKNKDVEESEFNKGFEESYPQLHEDIIKIKKVL